MFCKSKCMLSHARISQESLKHSRRLYSVGKHTKGYGYGVRNVVFPEQNPLMTARLFRNKRGPQPRIIQYVEHLPSEMDRVPGEIDQLITYKDEDGHIPVARKDPRLSRSDTLWAKKWRAQYLRCARLTDLDVDVWGMNRVELDAVSFKYTFKKQMVVDYPVIHNVMDGHKIVNRKDWAPKNVIPGFEHLTEKDPRIKWTKNSDSAKKSYLVDTSEGYSNAATYDEAATKEEKKDARQRITVFPKPENTEIYRRTLFTNSSLAGNYIPPRVLGQNEPNIFFRPEKNKRYTLVMFTPDYPFRLTNDPHNMIHWMKVNMKSPQDGDEILSYLPPIPTEYAGTFRYVFALFEQNQEIQNVEGLRHWMKNRDPQDLVEERFHDELDRMNVNADYIPEKPKNPAPLNDRRSVSMDELMKLCGWRRIWPSALSFFQTDYDYTVTETCSKNNIEELFYVPPDYENVHERKAEKRREKYMASHDWN